VAPSHLMDGKLFDFVGLKPDGNANPEGDTAFDTSEPISTDTDSSCQSSSVSTRPTWTIHVDADHLKNA